MSEESSVSAILERGIRAIGTYARLDQKVRVGRPDDEHVYHMSRSLFAAAARAVLGQDEGGDTDRTGFYRIYLRRVAAELPGAPWAPRGPIEAYREAGAAVIVSRIARRALIETGEFRDFLEQNTDEWLAAEAEFCALDERFVPIRH